MYLERHLAVPLRRIVQENSCVVLEGPRGAGKTTLLLREFPMMLQVNLEDAADRQRARQDPEGFLRQLRRAAVIDEVQRAPELVRYLRESRTDLPLILSSSARLGMPMPTLELYRPTLAERQRRNALPIEVIGRFAPKQEKGSTEEPEWNEADLQSLAPARDFDQLLRFAELARNSSGQGLQQQDLARQAGVSHRTAVRWLAALEASMLILRLEPMGPGFGRRIVQRPKIHFLSGSKSFESRVVSEIYRNARHAGIVPGMGYWRDSNGLEIPLVISQEWEGGLIGVAIVENPTPAAESALQRWMRLSGEPRAALISRRLPRFERREARVLRYELAAI